MNEEKPLIIEEIPAFGNMSPQIPDFDIVPVPQDFQPTYETSAHLVKRLPRRKPGRRGKLSYPVINKVRKAIVAGNYDEVVCDLIGVSRNTFYRWLRDGEAIAIDVEDLGEEYSLDTDEGKLAALEAAGYAPNDLIYLDFYNVVSEARAAAESRLSSIVYKAAEDDARLALDVLKTRYPQRWGKTRVEVSGPDGGPIRSEGTAASETPQEKAAREKQAEQIYKLLARAERRAQQERDSHAQDTESSALFTGDSE